MPTGEGEGPEKVVVTNSVAQASIGPLGVSGPHKWWARAVGEEWPEREERAGGLVAKGHA